MPLTKHRQKTFIASLGALVIVAVTLTGDASAALKVESLATTASDTRLFDILDGFDFHRQLIVNELRLVGKLQGVDYSSEVRRYGPSRALSWNSDGKDLGDRAGRDEMFYGSSGIESERLECNVRIEPRHFGTRLSLSGCTSSDKGPEWKIGLWVSPTTLFGLGVTRSLIRPAPASSELYYAFVDTEGAHQIAGGNIWWRAEASATKYELAITPIPKVSFKGEYQTSTLRDANQRFDRASSSFDAAITGSWSYESAHGVWEPVEGTEISISRYEVEIDSDVDAYSDGRRFAHFGRVGGSVTWFAAKVARNNSSLALAAGDGLLEAKGVVDAWPFLDGLERVVGERRHINAEASARWRLVTLKAPLVATQAVSLTGRIDQLHVRPNARIVTWRPLFLGFGIDDLRGSATTLKRAELVNLELSTTITWSSMALVVHVSQWLPIMTERYHTPTQSTATTQLASDRSWNGSNLSLSLVKLF